jgi:hypothetical protein
MAAEFGVMALPSTTEAPPALPFDRTFYAIMTVDGKVPGALSGYEADEIAEGEVGIIIPSEEFDGVCAALDEEGITYTVYMDQPNTSDDSKDFIVVVYTG